MGRHKFDRKKAVRFNLVPGPEKDGKPTVLFKPVQTKKSKLSKKQKKTVISQLADVDQVTINGKVVEEDQIPAYVLEQIKGRSDLLFNQMNGMQEEEEEVGDLYEIQDGVDDGEYEQYEDYDFEAEGIKEEEREEEYGSGDDEWEDQEQYSGQEDIEITEQDEVQKPTTLKFKAKVEEFPTLEEVQTVNIEGKEYQLTKKQIQMLDTVIPENYQRMDFGGLQFKKYNEDGMLFSEKQKYEKYLLNQNQKVVVVDTYEFVPSKPVDFIDNDLKPSQINANPNIKEVQEALNYEGQEEIYEQLEDDFFSKMIRGELDEIPKQQNKKQTKTKTIETGNLPSKVQQVQQVSNVREQPKMSEQQMEQKLEKAMYNFEHNIEQRQQKKALTESEDDSDEENHSKNNHTTSLNFQELEKKEQYIGKDGEMDWRFLTKQEKKAYMKTKIIREFYDEMREREIEDKMRGKANVAVEDLHLKKQIDHIPYQQDHVMQRALQQGLKQQNRSSQSEEEFSSLSEEDDIISFHQKTSIIATNLSIIEQPHKKKKKVKEQQKQYEEQQQNITKIKVVPERRNKNETSQERKERKNKLKEMKKQKRQQKRQFAERFSKIKKETIKKENNHNPLNKVSYVKIY